MATLTGTPGNDTLVGSATGDTFDGGAGNDMLQGGVGGDVYKFGVGYGYDLVIDTAAGNPNAVIDAIEFLPGITPADVRFVRVNNNLVIEIISSGDQLTIEGQFYGTSATVFNRIEEFRFSDGTILDEADIRQGLTASTSGDDYIFAFDTGETLDGGAGNDRLEGYGGDDIYVFDRGYGQDTVRDDETASGDIDVVAFGPGIVPGDLVYSVEGTNLVIQVVGTSDRLVIENNFGDDGFGNRTSRIEEFQFANETVLTDADIRAILLTGTNGDDTLVGFVDSDVVTANGGNDTIGGGQGDNSIDGGAGTDVSVYSGLPSDYSIVYNANGTVTVTDLRGPGFDGTDTLTGVEQLRFSDNSVISLVGNDPPQANADSYSASEDTPLIVPVASGLLGNDTDANSNPLTVTGFTNPTNGTVSVNVDGSFSYTAAPNYSGPDSFTYTVSDGMGGTSTATVTINVAPVNDAPVAAPNSFSTNEDAPLTFTTASLLAGDSDLEGDTITVTGVGQPSHGSVTANADGTFTYAPAANYNGGDSFTYTVSDGNGGTATATVSINVAAVNDAPVAVANSFSTNEDAPLTITAASLLAGDTDPDGNTLTVSGVGQPSHGSVTANADGTFTYTPTANYNGANSFSYTVSDGNGGTATATVNVNVASVNDAPVAAANSFSTNEDAPLTITAASLLAGDTDLDGDTLAVSGVGQPSHGSVTANADGTFTYTPTANYNGADSFSYTVSDGNGGTATATVNVNVASVNDAPVAAANSFSTNEDAPLTITAASLLAGDTDLDGDTLTVSGVGQPSHGSVTANADGTFTYTPTANYNGANSFSYTVSDGNGGTATATVNINVASVNDAPVAAANSFSTNEDAPLTITAASLLAGDSDLDGDTLTVSGVGQPSHGSVTANADGTFTYTPTANYNGANSFSYTVSDGRGGTATATVNVNVASVNDAPVAGADQVTTAANTAVSFSTASLLANDSDLDGGVLSVSGIGQPAHGSLVANANGTYTYTPTTNYSGSDAFTYTVSDGLGGTATATVNINVVGSAPPPTVPKTINGTGHADFIERQPQFGRIHHIRKRRQRLGPGQQPKRCDRRRLGPRLFAGGRRRRYHSGRRGQRRCSRRRRK